MFSLWLYLQQGAFQVVTEVRNLAANVRGRRGTDSIPGLGRTPEKGMETHSSILAWRITKDRGVRQATFHKVAESNMTEVTKQTCMLQVW